MGTEFKNTLKKAYTTIKLVSFTNARMIKDTQINVVVRAKQEQESYTLQVNGSPKQENRTL